ncbi:MAG: dihydrofolate reductase family protein [Ferrimicrobium sp.]
MDVLQLDTKAPSIDDLQRLYPPLMGSQIRANMTSSLDGAASVDQRSALLSSPLDRVVFHYLRAMAQVVLVGASTARLENYTTPTIRSPALAKLRTELGIISPIRLVVATRSELPTDWGLPTDAEVCRLSDSPSRSELVKATHLNPDLPGGILCEGGPRLLGSLSAVGVVDEYCVTISAKLVGEGPPSILGRPLDSPVDLTLVSVLLRDDGLLTRFLSQKATAID